MANKQIYELTTRTFDGDSLLPISVENPDSSTATEYPQLTGKTSGNALSDFVANSQQYTTDLDTTAKTITGAINEHQNEIGVSEYDSTQIYNIGDYVLYNGDMYFCKENSVTGAWNSNKWGQSTIVGDLSNIVVKRTLTETTTGNGNVVNYISVDNGIIIDARCTSQEAIVTTFINSQGTHYSFHVVSPTSQTPVVANTSVTIDFYMIPRRRIVTET